MTFTPFEREMLKEQRETNLLLQQSNKLLELLVMAHQPRKVLTGMASTGPADATDPNQLTVIPEGLQIGQLVGDGGTSFGEQALAAAGIFPMSRPGAGQPETPEQRAERFAARAKEVGLADDKVEEVSGRVQLNLDTLTEQSADPFASTPDGQRVAPAKKAPRKRTAPTA